jgi:hypothetical protein
MDATVPGPVVDGCACVVLDVRAAMLATYTTIGDDHGQSTDRQFWSKCGSPTASRVLMGLP